LHRRGRITQPPHGAAHHSTAALTFKAGETWWLSGDVEKTAAEEQAERRIVDPWESYIAEWLGARGTDPVTLADAFGALGLPVDRRDQTSANRVARIFKVLGWERFQRRVGGDREWAYRLSPVVLTRVGKARPARRSWTLIRMGVVVSLPGVFTNRW
jgi:predicted P-loop ATPase